jgi:hypothetical protein
MDFFEQLLSWVQGRKAPQLSQKAKKVIADNPEEFQRLYQQVVGKRYVQPLTGLQRIGYGQTAEQKSEAQRVQRDWLSRKVPIDQQKKPFWERPVDKVISEFLQLETPWGRTTAGEPKLETEAGRQYALTEKIERETGKPVSPQVVALMQSTQSPAEQYYKWSS